MLYTKDILFFASTSFLLAGNKVFQFPILNSKILTGEET